MTFRVQLDTFHGPLDLLLYLVKKEELPVAELPLALVTGQYLAYVELLEQLDMDDVGEFLDVASLLIEIKSRSVLPRAEAEVEAPIAPEENLVERLLEYKKFRDAAVELRTLSETWQQRQPRSVGAPPAREIDPAEQPLEGIELWDLVSAFARIMRDRIVPEPEPTTIRYDETPVHRYMDQVHARLAQATQPIAISELFEEERVHKSVWLGIFLAVLELVRYGHALALQRERYGEVYLRVGPAAYQPSGPEQPTLLRTAETDQQAA